MSSVRFSDGFGGGHDLAGRGWRAGGDGAPRALLIHGSGSSGDSWWRIGPALAERGWSVLAPDLPGHGRSPRNEDEADPAVLASALEPLLAEPLDLLVGHSLGTVVALELAARMPQQVRCLVLEEPAGPRSLDFDSVAEVLETGAAEARREPGAALAEMRAGFPRWHPRDCWHAVNDLIACDEELCAAGLRSGARSWRPVQLAAAVGAPTLVLLAPDCEGLYDDREDGSAIRGEERVELLAALGDADARVLAGGHCIHRDDPEAWLSATFDFLARQPVQPRKEAV